MLRKAAKDKRIAALLFLPEQPGAGWAKLSEIRAGIVAFRAAGKPVTAYLRTPSARDYYLASASSRIVAAHGGYFNVKGLRAELLYARGTLDKLGIAAEFESLGRYKDGADILTRTEMSATTREVMNGLLDARFEEWTGAIAAGRGKSKEEVRRLIDEGPFLAADAVKAGLADGVQFESEAKADLARLLRQDALREVDAWSYRLIPAKEFFAEKDGRIAFLVAEGDITSSPLPAMGGAQLDPEEFARVVKEIREDSSIQAVVLRMNSPGGDATVSEQMLHEVKLLAAKKPVVVSMSDVAASAGYQIALGGHVLCADPATITGSIGVFFGKLSLAGLYGKVGVNKQILTRGRHAAIDSDATPISVEERVKLRAMLERFYADFVTQVAAARGRRAEEIEPLAQGRIWLGAEAKRNGLIDELGGIGRAMELAAARAKLSAYQVVVYPKPGAVEAVRERMRFLRWAASLPLKSETAPGFWSRLPFEVSVD